MLTAAVAIATTRRPDRLHEALLGWARSARPVDQVVVVDAGEGAPARAEAARAAHPGLLGRPADRYLTMAVPSTTAQRNRARREVVTDVVVFADDDTLPHPRYLERVMEVFERDVDGAVGGVAGVPEGWGGAPARLRRAAGAPGRRWGQRYAMAPAVAHPPGVAVPATLSGLPLERRRGLNGCNMALRSALARAEPFDEHMLGWAYGEDLDVTFRVGRHHALVARTDAEVRLSVAHGRDVDPYWFFMARWVNPAYLIAKHDLGPPAWRALGRLLLAQRAAHLAAGRCPSARGRAAVAERYRTARREIAVLAAAGGGPGLVAAYDAVQARLMARGDAPGRPTPAPGAPTARTPRP